MSSVTTRIMFSIKLNFLKNTHTFTTIFIIQLLRENFRMASKRRLCSVQRCKQNRCVFRAVVSSVRFFLQYFQLILALSFLNKSSVASISSGFETAEKRMTPLEWSPNGVNGKQRRNRTQNKQMGGIHIHRRNVPLRIRFQGLIESNNFQGL